MGLESGTYINDLTTTNPLATDGKSQGDDHLRLIKSVVKATFPGMAGAAWRVQAKSAGYTVVANDNMTIFNCTAGLTLALTAAATLGNQHLFIVLANGGDVVIDPNASETINGATTQTVLDGSAAVVFCDSSAFFGFNIPQGTTMHTSSIKGADIASASPLVVGTDGDYFDVTGTTNFAAMTVTAGRHFFLQFDGALTMTHHATNLDLPGEANITTAAGDVAEFQSTGANTVQCVGYTRANGKQIASIAVSDLADGTDGELITWDAAGAPATVGAGTAAQVLTSNGAGAAPTFQDAAGGAWTLIGTATASASASLTVTGIDSTYDMYAIVGASLRPATDGVNAWLRVGDSSGVDSGASDYGWAAAALLGNNTATGKAFSQDADYSDSEIGIIQENAASIGNAATEGISFNAFLSNHKGTAYAMVHGSNSHISTSGKASGGVFAGARLAAITLDRVNFQFSSGNITSGRLTVWGISHA